MYQFIGFFFLFNLRYLWKNTAHWNSNYFDLTTVVPSKKIPVIDLYISRMFLNYFELKGAIFFLGYLKLKRRKNSTSWWLNQEVKNRLKMLKLPKNIVKILALKIYCMSSCVNLLVWTNKRMLSFCIQDIQGKIKSIHKLYVCASQAFRIFFD